MSDSSRTPAIFQIKDTRDYLPWIAIGALVVFAVVLLNVQGRVWWCQVGDYIPWSWEVWTPHNSQHVIDPYSFTHVLHGIIEFWLIGLIFFRMPLAWRLFLALLVESTWEVVENTDYIINRYRETTISLDYYGDSIINSTADIMCCGIGFLIAYKLRVWWSLAVFVATEAVLLFWIRDSLILNVIMLIYPLEAIRNWQMGI